MILLMLHSFQVHFLQLPSQSSGQMLAVRASKQRTEHKIRIMHSTITEIMLVWIRKTALAPLRVISELTC